MGKLLCLNTKYLYKYCDILYIKNKEVPQHTYGGAGGRGGIAPTH
jgi:hypothetical protein